MFSLSLLTILCKNVGIRQHSSTFVSIGPRTQQGRMDSLPPLSDLSEVDFPHATEACFLPHMKYHSAEKENSQAHATMAVFQVNLASLPRQFG